MSACVPSPKFHGITNCIGCIGIELNLMKKDKFTGTYNTDGGVKFADGEGKNKQNSLRSDIKYSLQNYFFIVTLYVPSC